ncbi:hypothetical protein KC734_22525 [candidate division KSB1 bacterium]|nr:hypothetical protein [candidate division KSB1 bacterium]
MKIRVHPWQKKKCPAVSTVVTNFRESTRMMNAKFLFVAIRKIRGYHFNIDNFG